MATAAANKATASSSSSQLLISAASTATANACNPPEGGVLAAPGAADAAIATAETQGDRSTASAGLNMGGARAKSSRVGCGIRGVTESRAVQAAALSRALDCLKDTGLNTSKGAGKGTKKTHHNVIVQLLILFSIFTESLNLKSTKEGVSSPNWHANPILLDPFEDSLKKTFAHLEDVPTVKTKVRFKKQIDIFP